MLPLFATRFPERAGGIEVIFIDACLSFEFIWNGLNGDLANTYISI